MAGLFDPSWRTEEFPLPPRTANDGCTADGTPWEKLNTILLTVRADFVPDAEQLCAAIDEAAAKAKAHVRTAGVPTTRDGGRAYMHKLTARVVSSRRELASLRI
jgi:hypothetical protein